MELKEIRDISIGTYLDVIDKGQQKAPVSRRDSGASGTELGIRIEKQSCVLRMRGVGYH